MLINIQGETLPLEIKQSGGKIPPLSNIRRGLILEEASRTRQRKRDILLGAWNVRSLYRTGSITAAARELARYLLDLMGVQEVRFHKGGTVRAGDYNFFYGKGIQNHQLGTGILYIKGYHQRLRKKRLLGIGCHI